MKNKISYLIRRVPKIYGVFCYDENLLRVYTVEDRDKALEKLKEYYDKYSNYTIVVETEGKEDFRYNSLKELLNEDWC